MKTLFVLRHAKAEHSFGVRDFDRSLTSRGERDAQHVGSIIHEQSLRVDLILSSSAMRTRGTVENLLSSSQIKCPQQFTDDLYHATVPTILAVLQAVSEEYESVLLVGHNPGLAEVVGLLSGWIDSFPTASLVRLDLPLDHWGELSMLTRGQRTWLWTPKGTPPE